MATLTRLTYFFSSTPLATIGANSTVKHQLEEGWVSGDEFIAADAPVENTAVAAAEVALALLDFGKRDGRSVVRCDAITNVHAWAKMKLEARRPHFLGASSYRRCSRASITC